MICYYSNVIWHLSSAVMLNSPQIFEKIFGDEFLMDIIGCLECKFYPHILQVEFQDGGCFWLAAFSMFVLRILWDQMLYSIRCSSIGCKRMDFCPQNFRLWTSILYQLLFFVCFWDYMSLHLLVFFFKFLF